MAASNRAAKITKLVTSLKKHFKPTPPAKPRTLLEHLLLACLLEQSPHDAAEQALDKLLEQYYDWNEVRVSTRRELAEVIKGLNDPEDAADRLRTTLQSVFETFYQFDLEGMKKQNLGVSIKQLEKLPGTTPFVVAYVVQNSLGGHSIPVNKGLLTALRTIEIITDSEAAAGTVPGLERAVPKNKGVEVGSVLHQLGVEVGKNPYGPAARKRLLALDPGCKDRLPKRPAKPKPEPPKAKPEPPKAKPVAGKTATGKATGKESTVAKKGAEKKGAEPKRDEKKAAAKPVKKTAAPTKKKKVVKKKLVKKKVIKKKSTPAAKGKPAKKKVVKKKVAKKKVASAGKKKKKAAPSKRKPR